MMQNLKRPYGVTPFWFWNDRLEWRELLRQIAAMDEAGVGGFVIHPRMGLPVDQGWMSEALLGFMRMACEEARRRGLRVILYDEGMYPSGSSAGQVVAENGDWQCRGIECRMGRDGEDQVGVGETLLGVSARGDGRVARFVDRPIPSVIRGVHYLNEDTGDEETPAAADLLNPEAMACYLRLVHEKYAAALGEFFGGTITGIFTDEPSLLGRPQIQGAWPGTRGILKEVRRLTGVDFGDRLAGLFFDEEPEAAQTREAWMRGVRLRMEETYYGPMAAWCRGHGLELMGHPERPGDFALERYFDVPGQDLVWRWVLPGETATRGAQSVQAKCAASAAARFGRQRNSNEFCGAYGHELTYEEMKFLADWCFVRGQNWMIPHAYYYSQRGPRRNERPPDVGLNAPWAARLGEFNGYCERMSQLIAESEHVVRVGVVCSGDECPWEAAEVLYQNQVDFTYVWEEDEAVTGELEMVVYDGVAVRPAAAVDAREDGWLEAVLAQAGRTIEIQPMQSMLRVRRMRTRENGDVALLFNEGSEAIEFEMCGGASGGQSVRLEGFETRVFPV